MKKQAVIKLVFVNAGLGGTSGYNGMPEGNSFPRREELLFTCKL